MNTSEKSAYEKTKHNALKWRHNNKEKVRILQKGYASKNYALNKEKHIADCVRRYHFKKEMKRLASILIDN